MSIKQFSKMALTAATLASGVFYTTQLTADGVDNLQSIKKDIKVISKVLESSTELEGTRSRINVSGSYFAKQGIVLKIRFPGTSRFDFNFDGFGSIVPIPVIPDVAGVFSDDELESIIEEAMESARETMSELEAPPPDINYRGFPFTSSSSIASKEFRKQQKELRKQKRDLERKVREIEQKTRKQTNAQQQVFLEKEQKELNIIRQKIRSQAKQMKQKLKAEKKKQQQQRTSMLNTWTANLADNFCNYAPYPRNLPKNEHLTLVITDAVYKQNLLEDKVIVINNRQLISCRDGKIDGKTLLAKSLSYSF